jgi:hypothetical protein
MAPSRYSQTGFENSLCLRSSAIRFGMKCASAMALSKTCGEMPEASARGRKACTQLWNPASDPWAPAVGRPPKLPPPAEGARFIDTPQLATVRVSSAAAAIREMPLVIVPVRSVLLFWLQAV